MKSKFYKAQQELIYMIIPELLQYSELVPM
jgi:hypothetical protein